MTDSYPYLSDLGNRLDQNVYVGSHRTENRVVAKLVLMIYSCLVIMSGNFYLRSRFVERSFSPHEQRRTSLRPVVSSRTSTLRSDSDPLTGDKV